MCSDQIATSIQSQEFYATVNDTMVTIHHYKANLLNFVFCDRFIYFYQSPVLKPIYWSQMTLNESFNIIIIIVTVLQ